MNMLAIDVECGDGAAMSIVYPHSFSNGGISWRLRYGNADSVRHVAASLIDSYDYLLSEEITMKEAVRRLRLMRQSRRAALAKGGGHD